MPDMPEKFTRSVQSMACSMTDMMAATVADHQARYGGRLPRLFILHDKSLATFHDETVRRCGDVQLVELSRGVRVPGFAGVPVARCACTEPFAPDAWIDCEGQTHEL